MSFYFSFCLLLTMNSFSFLDGGDGIFVIDPDSGVINTTRPLDYATRNLYMVNVSANNYQVVSGQRVIRQSTSPYSTVKVYIHVLPPSTGLSLIKDNVNLCKYYLLNCNKFYHYDNYTNFSGTLSSMIQDFSNEIGYD